MTRAILRAGLVVMALAWSSLAPGAADRNKILHWEFRAAETGFDPGKVTDYYSNTIIEAVFERLLTYDYLARPSRLVPEAAEAMPEVSDQGRTYLFRLKRHVHFTPDPVFRGAKRELTAQDVVYSIKRHMDPRNRSYWQWLVDGKIVGLDELAKRAQENGEGFDYDTAIPGLEAVDRYTVRIRLKETDYNFPYILAMPAMSIVAREVIEGYAADTNAHPVGTGAYMLTRWIRASRMRLEANPNYRGYTWNFEPGGDPQDREIVAAMKGRSMPRIGVVEVSVIEEEQSRWLAFQRGELDIVQLPWTFAPVAMPGGRLAPQLAARGVSVSEMVDPEITYTYFNMRDPVVGGFSKEKIALRRAIVMAYDRAAEVRVVRKGNAVEAQSPIPVGIVGYDPAYRSSVPYDVESANRLLDRFGYRRGPDGYRTLPDGSPLLLKRWSRTGDSEARELDELWARSLEQIGVRVEVVRTKFSDLIRAGKECQPMMSNAAWIADYPDADNFMQLLYGPHTGQSNYACYRSPEYDRLYEQSRRLPDSDERNRLFRQMSRLVETDAPWRLGVSRMRTMMVQPGILGYRKHPMLHQEWLYLDMAPRK